MITITLCNLRKCIIILLSLGIYTETNGYLTNSQISNYRKDGVILIKGLITGKMLQKAQDGTNKLLNQSNRRTPSYNYFRKARGGGSQRTRRYHSSSNSSRWPCYMAWTRTIGHVPHHQHTKMGAGHSFICLYLRGFHP